MSLLTEQLKKDYNEESWKPEEKDGKFTKLIRQAVASFKEKHSKLHILGDEMEKPHPEVAVSDSNYFTDECRVMLCGGRNGRGDWVGYMDDLSDVFKLLKQSFENVWLIKLDNDCLDDIFYLTIGCSGIRK